MNPALQPIGEMIAKEIGPFRDLDNALHLQMRTEIFKNPDGQLVCDILVFAAEGNLLLLCPQFLDLSGAGYTAEVLAACLQLQARGDTAVHYQLMRGNQKSDMCLATSVKLPLGDKIVTAPHLRHCLLDLCHITDTTHEPLREVSKTGNLEAISHLLPSNWGEPLNPFKA